MVTRQELDEAIRECEGEPATYAVCQKLAVLYTVRDYLYGGADQQMSYAAAPAEYAPEEETVIGDYGDSEFLRAVCGRGADAVWAVLDELMEGTLRVINPRLYNGVMRRIEKL